MPGTVVSINVAPHSEDDLHEVAEARAVPGRGLEGDRYFNHVGTYSDKDGPDREVTFIEIEAIEAARSAYKIDFEPAETRRNIVTRGVALNHLVGQEFTVGEVRIRGIRLCEPCKHVEEISEKPIRLPLVHRGGLRAQVLTEGVIHTGDAVTPGA